MGDEHLAICKALARFGPGFLEICTLRDATGKLRYDALLYRADSAVVFEARAKRAKSTATVPGTALATRVTLPQWGDVLC